MEEFSIKSLSTKTFLDVNNFVENFEDFNVGPNLRKLEMHDSFKYSDQTKFLENGTQNV